MKKIHIYAFTMLSRIVLIKFLEDTNTPYTYTYFTN